MFTLTVQEAALLGLGVLASVLVAVGAALQRTANARRNKSAARAEARVMNRGVAADLEWDEWKVRFVDVARCSVLDNCARSTCNRSCIRQHRAGSGQPDVLVATA
jgi:hypothetical protein